MCERVSNSLIKLRFASDISYLIIPFCFPVKIYLTGIQTEYLTFMFYEDGIHGRIEDPIKEIIMSSQGYCRYRVDSKSLNNESRLFDKSFSFKQIYLIKSLSLRIKYGLPSSQRHSGYSDKSIK
ncbi:hypothetical protein PHYBLDRAFT_171442 [Phycomyces blakesleeanus NRRL 1555(-)]|uniref:Uncharacterized protein n=1 Tax=Phycomyces blakesleeanus (strain ATCC 8743b / DSM 1359 / FGSC 10004 / NBRC 33097 / NRRL 1555) TaxID=763407 RepID=A0A167LLA4_PHYB8|nr:hypothetical protein PHYBLDRAFT_171442 [Phycomyces blakesleeanus NRRL 1555(-)]OAD70696.1 hypothetical protein PHYBLDRAFT_171442 [Phycomyces blakesleeanus NRRL 1555(-)]|eukprot:XP_018288736.1 hypothetical protein PHYBLDRAFT_171442 [Phycomyces blakesleeanus NRRL 1555(-)]